MWECRRRRVSARGDLVPQQALDTVPTLAHRPAMIPDEYRFEQFEHGPDIRLLHIDGPAYGYVGGVAARLQFDRSSAVEIAMRNDDETVIVDFGNGGDELEGVRQQTFGEAAQSIALFAGLACADFLDMQEDRRPPSDDRERIEQQRPQAVRGMFERPTRLYEKRFGFRPRHKSPRLECLCTRPGPCNCWFEHGRSLRSEIHFALSAGRD